MTDESGQALVEATVLGLLEGLLTKINNLAGAPAELPGKSAQVASLSSDCLDLIRTTAHARRLAHGRHWRQGEGWCMGRKDGDPA